MIEIISNIFLELKNLTSVNPMIQGALSLWGLGVLTYLARSIPGKISVFTKRLFIVDLLLDNTTYGHNQIFINFLMLHKENKLSKFSKTFSVESDPWDGSKSVKGPGYGFHFLFFKKRLYWFTIKTLDSSGSEKQKKIIKVSTFSRNGVVFDSIFQKIQVKLPSNNAINIFQYNKDGWQKRSDIQKRSIDSVILNNELMYSLKTKLDIWFSSKDWFHKRGLAYKLGFLFHGVPGTGKTSIIRSLASHFNRNVATLNLNGLTPDTLETAFHTLPKNSFVIIEDFDSCAATHKREKIEPDSADKISAMVGCISISNILNVLDGIVPLENVVLFLTTNHLDQIDPALFRPGRIDHVFEIEKLNNDSIKKYIKMVMPDANISSNITFPDILGCEAQSNFLKYRSDSNSFIQSFNPSTNY